MFLYHRKHFVTLGFLIAFAGLFVASCSNSKCIPFNFNTSIPFSFKYGEQASPDCLKQWTEKTQKRTLDKCKTQYTTTWTDPKTGLEVRKVAVVYSDFPVVEWTVYFKNNGMTNSPILSDIQGLDFALPVADNDKCILHGNKGDFCTADSYEPFHDTLTVGNVMAFAPASSGKSSDGPKGWPYYNLQTGGKGLIIAIGWPGQWVSSFVLDTSKKIAIKAGQQTVHCYLKPGEEIRTPLISLLFWKEKDIADAQNLWRKYYRAHIIPHFNGEPQQPILQIQVSGREQDTTYVKKFLQAGIKPDICWRDAPWYPLDNGPYKGGDSWLNTGTWEFNPELYPHGVKPYTDWIHRRGMNFLLWFEPERVGDPNSWLGKNHPEWLLPGSSHGGILNEGNIQARTWLTNHVDSMIKLQGLDWYREDMNGVGPLPAWLKNDTPDRQGITENMYVQGHLAYWDALKSRNPKLHIDACASGGRRNDLETMKRAVPLLRSDFQWEGMDNVVRGNQGHTYGLSSWFPFQSTGVYFYDTYSMRSFYLPGFGMGGLTPENTAAQHQAYSECARISHDMLYGDYYPLTEYSIDTHHWIAWQFNNPKEGTGIVQAFRRDDCGASAMTFRLRGLKLKAHYKIIDFDSDVQPVVVTGKELMEKGISVDIKTKPGAAIIKYQKE